MEHVTHGEGTRNLNILNYNYKWFELNDKKLKVLRIIDKEVNINLTTDY
jgi:hypothetical protein